MHDPATQTWPVAQELFATHGQGPSVPPHVGPVSALLASTPPDDEPDDELELDPPEEPDAPDDDPDPAPDELDPEPGPDPDPLGPLSDPDGQE